MTALVGDCPCFLKTRNPNTFTDPVETPGPTENTVCVFCGRVMRTNAGSIPRRASFDDETLAPGEQGRITAARARAGLIRGRPFDNAPPINPRPRQPWEDPGEPA
jgi:hypothetical protein